MDLDHGHGNGRSNYSRTDGNGTKKQSGKHQELDPSRGRNNGNWIVGNGSNKHSTRHLEHDDDAGSNEHSSEVSGSFLRRYLELDSETGSSNQSDTHSEVIKLWENKHNKTPSDTDSSKISEVIQDEDRIEGQKLISAEKRSSMSSSASSSDLSTDNLFQVDIKKSKTRSDPKPEENDIQLQLFQDKHDVPSKLEEGQNGDASLILTSEVSSVTDEPTLLQSPPVQMMGRVGELDTYKIPSAVFARSKSIKQVDHWSLPSSESLFSIRLENGSFSRDHIVSSNSGELLKSGEFAADPLVPVQDTDEKGGESDKREETSVPDDDVRDKTDPSIEEPIGKKPRRPMISWNSATIAHHSLDRVTTAPSIAFPARNKKKKYVWPSCNCSSCWLAVCRSWNCTILPDETCFSSKEKAQKQQQKELSMASSTPSKSARCNCSSCFSSCRWHWCCGCNCCSSTL